MGVMILEYIYSRKLKLNEDSFWWIWNYWWNIKFFDFKILWIGANIFVDRDIILKCITESLAIAIRKVFLLEEEDFWFHGREIDKSFKQDERELFNDDIEKVEVNLQLNIIKLMIFFWKIIPNSRFLSFNSKWLYIKKKYINIFDNCVYEEYALFRVLDQIIYSFTLIVTLVWLYFEILKIFSRKRN
jgi:hypothetical protein